jgi:hypothetical protein
MQGYIKEKRRTPEELPSISKNQKTAFAFLSIPIFNTFDITYHKVIVHHGK